MRQVKSRPVPPIAGAVATPTFAAVLDDALRRPHPSIVDAAMPVWSSQLVSEVRTPVLFGAPLTTSPPRWLLAEIVTAPRPDHVMTSVQRLAFIRFAALGGVLRANFSATDLRREYRLLAQRYHPDRNTSANPLEREACNARFGEATACYRCLRAVVGPRHSSY